MRVFDGKKAAGKILKEIKKSVVQECLEPVLAVILIGDDESSRLYARLKKEAGHKIGVKVVEYKFDTQVSDNDVVAKIKQLNDDENVHGIIVQLPLPAIFNADRMIEQINPQKDVDGFHRENRRLLEKEKGPHFLPVLPLAILGAVSDAVKNKLEELKGKNILALVNSEIFGLALKLVFAREGLSVNYRVRNTCLVLGLEKDLLAADVLITVSGCPNLVKDEIIKQGVILIDGGITRYHDGKVVGDIDRKSVESKAAFLTPVPGGIGPLTVALLLRNVYLAAKKRET